MKSLLVSALALSLFTAASPRAQEARPAPQHARLKADVGTWDATMTFSDGQGGTVEAKGVSVRKMPLGEFWLIDTYQGTVMGQAFKGHGTTGYDPVKGKFVGSWIDSMSPSMMVFEGDYDETGKILTMVGDGIGPDGKPAKHRLVTTIVNADEQRFEMFVTMPDGKEVKTMTIVYERRKRERDEVERRR